MTGKVFCQQPEHSAGRFFYLMISLGAFSIVLILALALFGLERTISRQVFHDAENDAVHVSRTILALVLLLFFTPSMLVARLLTRNLALVQKKLKEQASVDALSRVLSRSEALAQALDRIFSPRRMRKVTGLVFSGKNELHVSCLRTPKWKRETPEPPAGHHAGRFLPLAPAGPSCTTIFACHFQQFDAMFFCDAVEICRNK